jgi:hypothetical protein
VALPLVGFLHGVMMGGREPFSRNLHLHLA